MEEEGNLSCKGYLHTFRWTAGVRRQLLELKKELKCWEAMFQRKHGRKPNKVSCP